MLRHYPRVWLRSDLVAGFVLAALLLPQGMAYAQLAGMPPVTGIYATMVPMVVYALVGPSRILVVGPDSAVGPFIAAALLSMATSPAQSVELGSLLALLVGAVCVVGGLARAGFLTELLSKPVRVGYMNGLALIILASQIPKLLGFSTDQHTLRGELRATIDGIDQTSRTSLAIGLAALAVILAIRHVRPKLPGILAAVVLSTLAVSLLDLSVPVVGQLPSGLPTPSVPGAGGAERHRPAGSRHRNRVCRVRRHRIALTQLRRAHPAGRRSESGADRTRGGERQRRAVSGLSDQYQRVAHRGGRDGRVTHAASGTGGGGADGRGARRGQRDRPQHARIGVGRGRHRRRAGAVRPRRRRRSSLGYGEPSSRCAWPASPGSPCSAC